MAKEIISWCANVFTPQARVGGPTVGQRYNRASQLCQGAKFLASEVKALEETYKNAEYGSHADKAAWLFMASILSSVACLEASYYEALEDLGRDKDFFESIDREPLFDRYDHLLTKNGAKRLDRGLKPTQPVKLLVDLRNAIAHYRPEWDDNPKRSKKLEKKLRGMESPLMTRDQPFFPMRCSSAQRANWAADAVLEFVQYTRESLGLRFNWKS